MDTNIIVLLSTISTGFIALMGLIIRYFYLSKCSNVECCCIRWTRDIRAEITTNNSNSENIINTNNDLANNIGGRQRSLNIV